MIKKTGTTPKSYAKSVDINSIKIYLCLDCKTYKTCNGSYGKCEICGSKSVGEIGYLKKCLLNKEKDGEKSDGDS